MIVAICDDEYLFLEREKNTISDYLKMKGVPCTIECFSSGSALIDNLSMIASYDLIILDVEMPEMDGLSVAKRIREYNPSVPIAFLSAYIDYSTDGYRVKAIRYLLKDEKCLEYYLQECLDCAIAQMDIKERTVHFDFTIGKRTLKVNEIVYLESRGNYTKFIMTDSDNSEELLVRNTLTRVTGLMASYDFISLNPKVSVNMSYIVSISRYSAVMKNGYSLKISQKRFNDVNKAFSLYKGGRL